MKSYLDYNLQARWMFQITFTSKLSNFRKSKILQISQLESRDSNLLKFKYLEFKRHWNLRTCEFERSKFQIPRSSSLQMQVLRVIWKTIPGKCSNLPELVRFGRSKKIPRTSFSRGRCNVERREMEFARVAVYMERVTRGSRDFSEAVYRASM